MKCNVLARGLAYLLVKHHFIQSKFSTYLLVLSGDTQYRVTLQC
jgi:hypothetical protein